MIEAMKHDSKHPNSEMDHERFLRLLPQIRQQATIAFQFCAWKPAKNLSKK